MFSTMKQRWAVAIIGALLLSGCGGGTESSDACAGCESKASASSAVQKRALASPSPAAVDGEQSITLQAGVGGYAGSADAYINSFHSSSNFGAAEYLQDKLAGVGTTELRSLVRFAIFRSEGGPVPDGATINSATFSLYKAGFYGTKYQLRPVLADWVEGEVSWTQSRQGRPWARPGAAGLGSDVAASHDAEATAPWDPGWVAFDVTEGVRAMASGRVNRGWLLDPISGNSNAKSFYSNESTVDPTKRPQLTLRYTAAPVNSSPSVGLTSPTAGQSFAAGAEIPMEAAATDADGTVTRVEFFADGVKVGEVARAPFRLNWPGAGVGNHRLTAVAHDNVGAATTSPAVLVSVMQANAGEDQEVTLQDGLNGYAGASDAHVYEFHSGLNFGTAQFLQDRSTGTSRFRSMVRFAIFRSEGGPVPDGATITSARLSLYKSGSYNSTYHLRPLLADWVEGEVTWNQRRQGVPWSSPGATGPGSDIATSFDAEGVATWDPGWMTFDVTEGLRAMAGGRTNRGWLLDPVSGNANIKSFYSSEYELSTGVRPKLIVRFSQPADTSAATSCRNLGLPGFCVDVYNASQLEGTWSTCPDTEVCRVVVHPGQYDMKASIFTQRHWFRHYIGVRDAQGNRPVITSQVGSVFATKGSQVRPLNIILQDLILSGPSPGVDFDGATGSPYFHKGGLSWLNRVKIDVANRPVLYNTGPNPGGGSFWCTDCEIISHVVNMFAITEIDSAWISNSRLSSVKWNEFTFGLGARSVGLQSVVNETGNPVTCGQLGVVCRAGPSAQLLRDPTLAWFESLVALQARQ